jgi:hypothetical protein
MRKVTVPATTILNILTSDLNDKNRYKKIDNCSSSFMPVNVSFLNSSKIGDFFSISHTYEQNGDTMNDPEIVFLRVKDFENPDKFLFYPISYRQDGLGIYREFVIFDENENIKGYYKKQQLDCALFCNDWMENIKRQQVL